MIKLELALSSVTVRGASIAVRQTMHDELALPTGDQDRRDGGGVGILPHQRREAITPRINAIASAWSGASRVLLRRRLNSWLAGGDSGSNHPPALCKPDRRLPEFAPSPLKKAAHRQFLHQLSSERSI
jgi:hypothetical protein